MDSTDRTLTFVVGSSQDILAAGRSLSGTLGSPYRMGAAAETLAQISEAALAGLDDLSVRNFEAVEGAPEAVSAENRQAAAEDVLTTTLGQAEMAQVLLAAGQAVECEVGQADPDVLRRALDHLDATTASLTDQPLDRQSAPERTGEGPPDLPTALRDLRAETSRALDELVRRVTAVATTAVSTARRLVPAQFDKVWELVGQPIPVGKFVGRLIRLGLRAMETALDGLHRLLRAEFVAAARDKVHAIWEKAGQAPTASGVVRSLLGVDQITQRLDTALAADHLDPARLERANGRVKELDRHFGRLMDLAQGILAALGLVGVASAWLPPLLPHLTLALAAAYLTVVATSVVLGADYADSGNGIGLVRGVQGTVMSAVG